MPNNSRIPLSRSCSPLPVFWLIMLLIFSGIFEKSPIRFDSILAIAVIAGITSSAKPLALHSLPSIQVSASIMAVISCLLLPVLPA
ncbi:Uncharacterised protein [Shigella sonnei]|nr:Uncharacterised protein [Shigella sonnei]